MAAARQPLTTAHRRPGTPRNGATKRTAASTRFVAMPATIEAWTPIAGTSTKPASTVPPIAPSVFMA